MECISEKNLKDCTCTYTSCEKRGKCCLCVAYHRKRNEIPGCFFKPQAERVYDRSIRFFIESHK